VGSFGNLDEEQVEIKTGEKSSTTITVEKKKEIERDATGAIICPECGESMTEEQYEKSRYGFCRDCEAESDEQDELSEIDD